MSPRRLRAPAVNGELLADPALDQAPARLRENARRLQAWDAPIQGVPASRLRREARNAALAAAGLSDGGDAALASDQTPWVVTGHQPELFHPGVWVKNFAVGSIARAAGGFGLHMIVDNDLPKSAAIRVPSLSGEGRLRLHSVPFDRAVPETPYEDWAIADETLFHDFDTRARETLGGLVDHPLIGPYWLRVLDPNVPPFHPGSRFPAARQELERSWGLDLAQVFLSDLCRTAPFLRFAIHLLAQAGRFREIHNKALARHRRANHIRSRNHPVPDLAGQDGGIIETPFWTWTADNPRRRPLFVRTEGTTLHLQTAAHSPFASLDLRDTDAAIARLETLADNGRRIRTRALTTTMFARLFLSDLFIHGIGGAKYDELGDVIIDEFFELPPPAFLVLSQTVWLDLDDFPGVERELARVKAELRDLTYNPDRHLAPGADPEFDRLRQSKRAAIDGPQTTRADRAARARAIRAVNEQMQPWVADRQAACSETAERLQRESDHNRAAHHRDLAFVLHDADRLQAAFARVGSWK